MIRRPLGPNRKYPFIPTVTGEVDSHTAALKALIEAVAIHERRTQDIDHSFVRVHELVDMGLITIKDGQFNVIDIDISDISGIDIDPGEANTGDTIVWNGATQSWEVGDHGDLAGLEDDDHPQYTAWAQDETITGQWQWVQQLWGPVASAAAPSFSFGTDPDTGMYRPGTNQLGFATTGVLRLTVDGAVSVTSTLPYYAPVGSDSGPVYTFTGDTNTGMYRVGADQLGFATGGTLKVTIDGSISVTSTLPFYAPNGSVTIPAYTFSGDTNTGLYWVGADNLGISVGGALHWDISTTRTFQDVYGVIRNYTGLLVENPDYLNAGVAITTITGTDPHNNGIGNQIAFWEVGVGGAFTDRSYGFRIRHTGDINGEGNLDWYRHENNTSGVLFLRYKRDSSQMFGADGAASTPIWSFFSDEDTGMYLPAVGQLGFTVGGTLRLSVLTTSITATVPYFTAGGSASAPAYSFSTGSDSNTGMYRVGADDLGFTTGGTLRFDISTTIVTSTLPIQGPAGSAGTPTFSFSGDPNTGIYNVGADQIGVSVGGTLRFDISTSMATFNVDAQIVDGKQLLLGTNDAMVIHGSAVNSPLEINSDTFAGLEVHTHNATASNAAVFYGARSRGSTASPTIIADNDWVVIYSACGYDGTDYEACGLLSFEIDGTPGSNAMPGRLRLWTTPAGSFTPVERLRISSAGAWGLGGANYGTAGQVLSSNGSSAPPTWEDAGTGTGVVETIVGTTNQIDVNSADPANPVLSLASAVITSLGKADTAVQPARQIISGAGLTGGGDLSADRTLAVGAGTGITVNADDVQISAAYQTLINGAIQASVLTANGDILIRAAGVPAPLPIGTTNYVLTVIAGAPSWQPATAGTPANPTASVGLTAVNGVATTYMRSDAAPALDQTITPTWSGLHTFTSSPTISNTAPTIRLIETDAAADAQRWQMRVQAGEFTIIAALDDGSAIRNAFSATRNAASSAITALALGNATNVPPLNLMITDLQINSSSGTAGYYLRSGGAGAAPTWAVLPSAPAGANPTASVGTAAVNGSASTFLRSDGAPAIDQAMVPSWSGIHTHTNRIDQEGSSCVQRFTETDAGSDGKVWRLTVNADSFGYSTRTDADGAGRTAISLDRSGVEVVSIQLGNSTSVTQIIAPTGATAGTPTYSFIGDTDTGIRRSGANALAISTGGVDRLTFGSSGQWTINSTAGTTGQILSSKGSGATPEWVDATGISSPSLETEILADTPIGYYKCDEASGNFADSSGNSRTMTASGTITYAVVAIVPRETTKFAVFGATGKGQRTDTMGLSVPVTGDWTVTAVIAIASASPDHTIFAISGSGELEVNNTQINARVDTASSGPLATFWENGAGGDNITTASRALAAPIWRPCHAAWVKDGTANTVSFYINGMLMDVVAYTNEPTGGGGAGVVSEIHGNGAGTSQAVTGCAHIAIFSSVLSQARIRAQAKAAGFIPAY